MGVGFENYGIDSGMLVNPGHLPGFLELADDYPDELTPVLDQKSVILKNLTADQQHWRDNGYLIKRDFIPHSLIDEYLEFRENMGLGENHFPDSRCHLYCSVVRDMCCLKELHYLLVDLVGEEMGLHFTLSNFKSTQRGWHQDDYLNPPDTMGRYVAAWMAMGDIHPDAGPFEFVPGSHKWPCLSGDKVKALVKPEAHGPNEWVIVAEHFVNKAVEQHMREVGTEAAAFDAKKGDILIWHAKLMHRGSVPRNPQLLRPALIGHYAAIRNRRHLAGEINRIGDGGYFWEHAARGQVLTADRVSRGGASPKPANAMKARPVFSTPWPRLQGLAKLRWLSKARGQMQDSPRATSAVTAADQRGNQSRWGRDRVMRENS